MDLSRFWHAFGSETTSFQPLFTVCLTTQSVLSQLIWNISSQTSNLRVGEISLSKITKKPLLWLNGSQWVLTFIVHEYHDPRLLFYVLFEDTIRFVYTLLEPSQPDYRFSSDLAWTQKNGFLDFSRSVFNLFLCRQGWKVLAQSSHIECNHLQCIKSINKNFRIRGYPFLDNFLGFSGFSRSR